jgi:methionyl-tRNA formyltransferase
VRVVYLGTPADAVPPLRALVDAGYDVALVVTQPDRRRSRGHRTDPSPVKQAAEVLGLPVATPTKAREVVDDVRESGAVLGVTVAFGQLLPKSLLDALPLGFVNLHFSLLPRWRGAAPVERAILAGDAETGVCLMQIDEGLDTGPVYASRATAIGPDETAGALHARLVELGTELLLETLPAVPTITPVDQAGEPTYADKLTVDEFRIDWSRPADEIHRLIRAGNPRPGAWTTAASTRLKIWGAAPGAATTEAVPPGTVLPGPCVATGTKALALVEVQPEARPRMSGAAWLAGHHLDGVLGEA